MTRTRLFGHVLAITGASSGIGAATAMEASKAGMRIALAGRRLEKLEQVAAAISASGGEALVYRCDVDHDLEVNAFIEAVRLKWRRLDAIFANSGFGIFDRVLNTTDADLRAMFETNFYGTIRLIRAAVPLIRQNPVPVGEKYRGHILICSSAASRIGPPMLGFYAATKAAQHMTATALRGELDGEHIAVSTVHPIGTKTEFGDRMRERPSTGGIEQKSSTPDFFRQTQEHAARAIVRAMKRHNPPPEIWPHTGTRFGLALTAAFPRIGAWAMRKHMKTMRVVP
ncbi:MAG: SDR family NAD(P)-dependent oxidoreductase [Phycisphaeraceae bacterium]|nr:SDR family NAD(P)-dependent oxidoreductase [Phycisphaeraceae bacterium]